MEFLVISDHTACVRKEVENLEPLSIKKRVIIIHLA